MIHSLAHPKRFVYVEGALKHTLDVGYYRLLFSMLICVFCFTAIGFRLINLALTDEQGIARKANVYSQFPRISRGDILDRNGTLLATNLMTTSVFADPKHILNPEETALELHRIFPEINPEHMAIELASGKRFVWIRRGLTPTQEGKLLSAGLPGVEFLREEKRFYPQGSAFAHVLGYVNVDGKGMAGMEQSYDSRLQDEKKMGKPDAIALTLDARIQHAMHGALSDAMKEFRAVGAVGVVMDVNTAEILAMASLPDFDPNRNETIQGEAMFNRATLGVYEMGSTFKAFTVAMALDKGTAALGKTYDATTPIRVGRFTINDYHPENRVLTTAEAFMHSSNIATAHIADEVGADGQKAFFQKMGFLDPLKLDVKEVGKPLKPSQWSRISALTISFGHGLSVTPIHLINGVATMVNGGLYRNPTLVKDSKLGAEAKQVIKPTTSRTMRKLMRLVVEKGTAAQANVPGYVVGGKTGTAEKLVNGRYSAGKRMSSFVGVFPMHKPKYAVLVIIDEPKATAKTFGYATGGWTAAPAVAKVIQQMGSILALKPYDEATPAIVEALQIPASVRVQ